MRERIADHKRSAEPLPGETQLVEHGMSRGPQGINDMVSVVDSLDAAPSPPVATLEARRPYTLRAALVAAGLLIGVE